MVEAGQKQPQTEESGQRQLSKRPSGQQGRDSTKTAAAAAAAPLGHPLGKRASHRQGQVNEEQRQPRGAQSLTALTALGTVALYTSVRGGITVFHHMRRKFLRTLLFDLSSALHDLGYCYWLDFGSLLGIHRDGDLILHDNDIDLAVLSPDWPVLLASLRGVLPQYSMRIVVPSDDPNARFMRVYCPLGMADVFGATPAGAERLLVDCGHGSCTEISRKSVLPTGLMTWRGVNISVPGDIPAALEERYGDWRTPKYMDKGADVVEGQKLYARIFRALSSFGIRI